MGCGGVRVRKVREMVREREERRMVLMLMMNETQIGLCITIHTAKVRCSCHVTSKHIPNVRSSRNRVCSLAVSRVSHVR